MNGYSHKRYKKESSAVKIPEGNEQNKNNQQSDEIQPLLDQMADSFSNISTILKGAIKDGIWVDLINQFPDLIDQGVGETSNIDEATSQNIQAENIDSQSKKDPEPSNPALLNSSLHLSPKPQPDCSPSSPQQTIPNPQKNITKTNSPANKITIPKSNKQQPTTEISESTVKLMDTNSKKKQGNLQNKPNKNSFSHTVKIDSQSTSSTTSLKQSRQKGAGTSFSHTVKTNSQSTSSPTSLKQAQQKGAGTSFSPRVKTNLHSTSSTTSLKQSRQKEAQTFIETREATNSPITRNVSKNPYKKNRKKKYSII